MPLRTGLTTTARYPLPKGRTAQVKKPLLNPHMARLKGSMGSFNLAGRTMASSAGRCEGVPGGVFGCAKADSSTSPPKAAINRRLDLIFIFRNDQLGFIA